MIKGTSNRQHASHSGLQKRAQTTLTDRKAPPKRKCKTGCQPIQLNASMSSGCNGLGCGSIPSSSGVPPEAALNSGDCHGEACLPYVQLSKISSTGCPSPGLRGTVQIHRSDSRVLKGEARPLFSFLLLLFFCQVEEIFWSKTFRPGKRGSGPD